MTPVMRWKKGAFLGKGAYGSVYVALNENTGELFAVKQVSLSETDAEETKRVCGFSAIVETWGEC